MELGGRLKVWINISINIYRLFLVGRPFMCIFLFNLHGKKEVLFPSLLDRCWDLRELHSFTKGTWNLRIASITITVAQEMTNKTPTS